MLGLGFLSIGINITLAVVKIVAGVLGNSYALIADGIESAGDVISSVITWAGFHLSLRPPDANHPYGHGKIESLAGMFSGLSLMGAAVVIAWHSIGEIMTPHDAPSWFTLPVLLGVIVTKEVLSRKVLKAGDALGSVALKGDAWHHRSDALTSAAAAVGISIALFAGEGYEAADDWAALLACIVILINGIIIVKGALHDVLDGAASSDTIQEVTSTAMAVPAVTSVENVRVRKSGVGLLADLHVRVSPQMTVFEGHRISHEVKDAIMESNVRVFDVIVHLEPACDDEGEADSSEG